MEQLIETGIETFKDYEAENVIEFIKDTFKFKRTYESDQRVTIEITGIKK